MLPPTSKCNKLPSTFIITGNHLGIGVIGIAASIIIGVGIYLAIQHGIFDKIFNIIHHMNTREIILTSIGSGILEISGIGLAILLGYKLAYKSNACKENQYALGEK